MQAIVIRPLEDGYYRVVKGQKTTPRLNKAQVIALLMAEMLTDEELVDIHYDSQFSD